MLGELKYNAQNRIDSPLSAYQPSQEIADITLEVKNAYQKGDDILNSPFDEFNGLSVIQRMNEDQRNWLSWMPEPYEGEDGWRWNGVRPITRNRVISVASHLTSNLLIPGVFAQNEFDEEDRSAAYVMRDMMEYNVRNSNYDTTFLFGVIAGLVNPVSFFKIDFVESLQEIWSGNSREQVVDDVMSGFEHSLLSVDDVLISNPYQFEIQKQDWIIEKRGHISYGEAKAKYGWHDNFDYVETGKKVIMGDDTRFYDVEDVNDDLVEEIVYKCRRKDQEIPFVGGIYMGGDNPEYNPFKHRTNKNKPKYNIAKFGYEPIDNMRFFYYKSLAAKMSNDQEAADREWQMYFDATFLSTFPPTITMGAGKIDRSVIAPATNTDIDKDAKIEPLQISDPNPALMALREAERSINESSVDPQLGGKQQGPEKTARESILLQRNAETNMSITAKMIGRAVKDIGELMVDDIIRYQTIGDLEEITGKTTYKTFLLNGKIKGGKETTSHIVFTDKFAGRVMSDEEKEKREVELYEKAGEEKTIYEVNPLPFSRMDYLITIDAEEMLQRDDNFERAFKLETYDRAVSDPLVQQDPEAHQKILRDFLFEPLMKGEASNYLPNVEKIIPQVIPKGRKKLSDRVVKSAATENLKV